MTDAAFPPLQTYPKFNRTFAGVNAQHAASTYTEIDRILAASKARRIVELGTADGALSMYLGLCGRRLGLPVYTIDVNPVISAETRRVLSDLGVTAFRLDCFKDGGAAAIKALISDAPVYLLCDNGDKKGELREFAPCLLPGSMVSAHDWLQEVGPQHVHDVLEALRLMPFREEAWSEDGLRMATWEVPDRGQQPSSSLEASTTWRKGDDVSWHRETVGGNWDFMGEAQLRILESYGLRPHSLLLDVGCGSLRLGVKAIAFLEAGGYFGVDCHKELLDVGIKRELEPSEALRAKGPMFAINSNFDLSAFGETTFDMAIAQSVFTHLPPQDIELCLRSVMSRLGPDGVFLASYNAAVGGWAAFGQPYPEMTRYSPEMFASIASRLGIRVENVGQWGIPQNSRNEQLLLAFRHR